MQKLSYSNSLNSDDKRTLGEWKKVDSDHTEEQLSKILFLTSVKSDFDDEAKKAAFKRFLTQIEHEEAPVSRNKFIQLNGLLKVAATLLLLVFAWYGTRSIQGTSITYSTTAEKQSFSLPDGSEIILNTNSELVYSEGLFADRSAKLIRGKGMFDIARDESKPFRVAFEDGEVEVLGTEFVIDLEDSDEVSVTVREGKVSFVANMSRAFLTAKEKGVFNKRSKKLIKKKRRSFKDFDWLLDDVPADVFHNYSIFVDQLEDDFDIVIQDGNVSEKFKNCKLSFNYNDNPEAVIQILKQSFGLNVDLLPNNNSWIFSGGKCKN